MGPGTPAGEWFRHWLAVGMGEELRDIPVGVKVLGEELVLFREGGKSALWGFIVPAGQLGKIW
jgi:hypothetical protein